MKANHTEIRRRVGGSIDTDYYLRHCHHQRSLSAHRAIDRSFNTPWALIHKLILRWSNRAPEGNAPEPAE